MGVGGRDHTWSVRFAEDAQDPAAAPPPAAAAPPLPDAVAAPLGLLLEGGEYEAEVCALPAGCTQLLVTRATHAGASLFTRPASGGGGALCVRVDADRRGPLDAAFSVALPQLGGRELRVSVTATVVPRAKGTPALRPHVRCVGFGAPTDAEGG